MAKVYNSKSNAVRAFRTQFAAVAANLTNDQIRDDYLDEDDGGWVLIDPATVQAEDERQAQVDAEQAQADAEYKARQQRKADEAAATAKAEAELEARASTGSKPAPAPVSAPKADKAPAAPKPAKASRKGVQVEANREERNGVKRPSIGGVCRAVWDECDAMAARGEQPTVKALKEAAPAKGWNPNNAAIEFYQWRKFNGITGRAK